MFLKSYDDVIEFDYTNIEEWKKFIRDDLLPLYASILELRNLRHFFKHLPKKDFSFLLESNINIREMFLGGVNEEGEYNLNSIAKLYKEVLGISLNLNEWFIFSQQSGIKALKYIKINVTNPIFYEFMKKIKNIMDKLYAIIGINPPEINQKERKRFLDQPILLENKLKGIHPLIVNISATYNYHTFFCLNIRRIPRFYIELSYPRLKNNFEEFSEFIGFVQKFDPKIIDEKEDFSIWGHKEDGIADLIYKLTKIIWEYFDRTTYVLDNGDYSHKNVFFNSLGKIGKIINVKKAFFNKILPKLLNIKICKWTQTKEIIDEKNNELFDCNACKENNYFITSHWIRPRVFTIKFHYSDQKIFKIEHSLNYTQNWGNMAQQSKTSFHEGENIHLSQFFINISPLLFFNAIKIQLYDNRIIINDNV